MTSINQNRFQLLGWVFFVFSALIFITSSLRAGDLVSLIGGLLFLFACFVFLIPLVSTMRSAAIQMTDNKRLPG
jgi:hypothetical protein